ncbi:MAG: hypothetical protein WCG36_03455 [bacterium]
MNAQNQEYKLKDEKIANGRELYLATVRRDISSRDGLTFVEILIAMLVLVILAIAGAALVSRGQVDTEIQKYKRIAIEAANGQMEKVIHELDYSTVAGWEGSPRATNTSLNGISGFAMTTNVVNAGSGGDDCLKVTVSVAYRKSGGTVELETYRSK